MIKLQSHLKEWFYDNGVSPDIVSWGYSSVTFLREENIVFQGIIVLYYLCISHGLDTKGKKTEGFKAGKYLITTRILHIRLGYKGQGKPSLLVFQSNKEHHWQREAFWQVQYQDLQSLQYHKRNRSGNGFGCLPFYLLSLLCSQSYSYQPKSLSLSMCISASISIPYLDLYLVHVSNILNLPFSHMPFSEILYLIAASAHLLLTNVIIIQILPWPPFPLILQLLTSWHNHELLFCASCTLISTEYAWFILTEQPLL